MRVNDQPIGGNGCDQFISGPCMLTLRATISKMPALEPGWSANCESFHSKTAHWCVFCLKESPFVPGKQIKCRIVLDNSEDKGADKFPNQLVIALVWYAMNPRGICHYLILAPTCTRDSEFRRVGMGDVYGEDWFEAGITKEIHLV
jgi:hypothetical protein